jgi:uncharacterized protein YciI
MLKSLLATIILACCAFAQAPPARQFLLRIEVTRQDYRRDNATEDEKLAARGHWLHLLKLHSEGKLTYAGQVFDPKGLWGIIVVNAPDAETAKALLDADPGIKAGFFRGEVLPFRTVLDHRPTPAAP